jgi:pheromone shutdown protein TraB
MKVTIVPVAHISERSVLRVKKAIAEAKPDVIAVELDRGRLQAMLDGKEPTLRELASRPFAAALYVFQKAVGKWLRIMPGSEMLAAVEAAKESKVPVALIDQDISVTMARLSRIPLSEKLALVSQMLLSPIAFLPNPFSRKKPADFERLAQGSRLAEFFREFSEQLPNTYRVLVEERDEHMFLQLLRLKAENVVVVVGAGHALGMAKRIRENGGERLGAMRFRLAPLPRGVAS